MFDGCLAVVGVPVIRLCFRPLIMDKRGRWRNEKESYRDRCRSALGNRWVMSSDDGKRVDDAMLVEEDRQQQQSPDDAPSTKLVCGEDTTEKALTKALKSTLAIIAEPL